MSIIDFFRKYKKQKSVRRQAESLQRIRPELAECPILRDIVDREIWRLTETAEKETS